MRPGRFGLAAGAVAAVIAAAAPAAAHDGVEHPSAAEATRHLGAVGEGDGGGPGPTAPPFPVDIDVRFDLVDHTGTPRTEADFAGRPMAIFFGYANCAAMCPVALQRIGAAIDILGAAGATLQPIMITVDPARDKPAAMGRALHDIHPRLIGLTGEEARLAAARAAFQVEAEEVARDPVGNPIYAHGSFIYLVAADGRLASVLPPILGPERIADIIERQFYSP
jgi:protein SCO1/2